MAIMAERDAAVRERNAALDERRRAFAERDMAMLQRDAAIAERDTAVEERDNALHALQMEENTMFDNEIPHNYTIPQLAEHGYDPSQIPPKSQDLHVPCGAKPRKTEQAKETNGEASSTKKNAKSPRVGEQGSEGFHQVNVGSSKVWGSDALDMMM